MINIVRVRMCARACVCVCVRACTRFWSGLGHVKVKSLSDRVPISRLQIDRQIDPP